jgi:hypothetical protein
MIILRRGKTASLLLGLSFYFKRRRSMEYYYLHAKRPGDSDIKLNWAKLRNAIDFIKEIAPIHFTKILKEGDEEIEIDLSLVNTGIKEKVTVILDYEVVEVRAYNIIKKTQEEVKIPGELYVPYTETIERNLIGRNLKLYEIIDDDYPSDIKKVPTGPYGDDINTYNGFVRKLANGQSTIDFELPSIYLRIGGSLNKRKYRKVDTIRVVINIFRGVYWLVA